MVDINVGWWSVTIVVMNSIEGTLGTGFGHSVLMWGLCWRLCQWVAPSSVGTVGDVVSRSHILVGREDMLLRPTVAVDEGAGNYRRGYVVDLPFWSHLYGDELWAVRWYLMRVMVSATGKVLCLLLASNSLIMDVANGCCDCFVIVEITLGG